jgi:NAD(P)-dependent dehydrogenase (short-subunit alcohol dehydrogenase family)
MEELTGRIAVVTGAGSGIGRALALRLGEAGMRVVAADIDEGSLDDVVGELASKGVEAIGTVTDVSRGEEVERLAQRTLEMFGGVDVVCNNAGIGGGGMVAGFDVDQWSRVIEVDLWGVLHGMRVFLPLLIEQGEGHVVNTASVAGLLAAPFMGPYAVSKFGVLAISESAFYELAMLAPGVGISVLCPGWVKTNIAASALGGNEGDPQGELIREALRNYVESGMDPAEVADQVVKAILSRQFYILTHDNSPALVRRRMEAIVSGDDPIAMGMEDI